VRIAVGLAALNLRMWCGISALQTVRWIIPIFKRKRDVDYLAGVEDINAASKQSTHDMNMSSAFCWDYSFKD